MERGRVLHVTQEPGLSHPDRQTKLRTYDFIMKQKGFNSISFFVNEHQVDNLGKNGSLTRHAISYVLEHFDPTQDSFFKDGHDYLKTHFLYAIVKTMLTHQKECGMITECFYHKPSSHKGKQEVEDGKVSHMEIDFSI